MRNLAVSFTLNTGTEQKRPGFCTGGAAFTSRPGVWRPGSSGAWPSLSRDHPSLRDLWQPQAWLWPAVQVLHGLAQKASLLVPSEHMSPPASTRTACCKAYKLMPREGKRHKHPDPKAPCPAQHCPLGSKVRYEPFGEQRSRPALTAPGLKDYVHPLGEIVTLQSNTKNIYKNLQTCNKIKICEESVHFYSFCTR
jgi:hypothetical protein